jgi:hypothetical protein
MFIIHSGQSQVNMKTIYYYWFLNWTERKFGPCYRLFFCHWPFQNLFRESLMSTQRKSSNLKVQLYCTALVINKLLVLWNAHCIISANSNDIIQNRIKLVCLVPTLHAISFMKKSSGCSDSWKIKNTVYQNSGHDQVKIWWIVWNVMCSRPKLKYRKDWIPTK